MFCKICGKPLLNNGKCYRCGYRQQGYATAAELNIAADERISTIKEEDLSEPLPDYATNNYNQNQVTNSENQLALTGLILAVCSLFFAMLALPSFIVSIVALVKSKSMNGAGRSKAIVGLVISSLLLLFIIFIFVVYLSIILHFRNYFENTYTYIYP